MELGSKIILIHLSKIETLLTKATQQKNPGMWLFQNDLRTHMFMLEALFRVYEKVYDNKDFKKRKNQCKQIEDVLGSIDHYSVSLKALSINKKISVAAINYLKQQAAIKLIEFNTILQENNWLDGKRIEKIKQNIEKNKWFEEEKEIKLIKAFYVKSINKVKGFVDETTFVFDNIEEDVHELRRRLRWLSIYPQALKGVFIYSNSPLKPTIKIKKYLTPEIVNSPYNIMPTDIIVKTPIPLNKNNFLALSWMIKELGSIKDEGLRVLIMKESLENIKSFKKVNFETESYKLLGKTQHTLKQLLLKSQEIVETYFKEDSISKLV